MGLIRGMERNEAPHDDIVGEWGRGRLVRVAKSLGDSEIQNNVTTENAM